MVASREIELKLEIGPRARAGTGRRLVRSVAPGEGEVRDLVSRYFDTSRQSLRKRGLVLRVRRDGERSVQTLKQEGDGTFSRPEWESPVEGDAPDLDAVETSGLWPDLSGVGTLRPLVQTDIRRTTWQVDRNGSLIEVALDEGSVSAASRTSPVAEIELELKRGEPGDLFRLALDIASAGPVKLGMRSKSERGFGLLDHVEVGATKSDKLALDPGLGTGAAFQAVARACLLHFRLNEAVLIATRDPEALHQARVAMRRLRSAFSLFKPLIAGDEAESLKGQLRALSGALGEARNLDVYRDRTLAREAEAHPDEPGLGELLGRIDRDRELAYRRVLRRLDGKRLRVAMLRLAAFVETGAWLMEPAVADVRERPLGDFAAAILEKRWRRLRKHGRHLGRLSAETRHGVRIEAKKLRYACEFFASLADGRKAKRHRKGFLGALEALQGGLGELNDIATGHEMAVSLAREGDRHIAPAALFAAGHVSGEADERMEACLAAAELAHRRFRKATPFWGS